MDSEKINILIAIVGCCSTLLATLFKFVEFKRKKKMENSKNAFVELYIPLLKLIEKHLYNNAQFDSKSFIDAKTKIRNLFEDKYVYVPFELNDRFLEFEKSKEKNRRSTYNLFCDSLIFFYDSMSSLCGLKPMTINYRNRHNIYKTKLHKVWFNFESWFKIISYLITVLFVFLILYLLVFRFLMWVNA